MPEPKAAASLHHQDGIYVIQGLEHQQIDVPLDCILREGSLNIFPEIAGSAPLKIAVQNGKLSVSAGGLIGLIPINERVTIDVRTKIPVGNLEHILAVANSVPLILDAHDRSYGQTTDSIPSVPQLYASALLKGLEQISYLGSRKDYTHHVELTSRPQGRPVLSAESLFRMRASANPQMEWSWFSRSADTPENRCIKYALHILLQQHYATEIYAKGVATKLVMAYDRLRAIQLDHSKRFLKAKLVLDPSKISDDRSYYRNVVRLAKAIIGRHGISIFDGQDSVRLPPVVINMNDAFEHYVRNFLTTAFSTQFGCKIVDGNKNHHGIGKKLLFDRSSSGLGSDIPATPDIVVAMPETGGPQDLKAVIEVKYKICRGSPHREDLNQALVYALTYRAKDVVIVYAAEPGESAGVHFVGAVAGINVYKGFVDISTKNLADAEAAFCESLGGILFPAVPAEPKLH